MSTISASTTTTTAYKVTADTTGTLVLQTGATPTTALTIDASQNITTANRFAKASMPAGTILQVVSTTKTTVFSSTSSVYVDVTGLSVSITPSATSSTILILVTSSYTNSSVGQPLSVNLVRNSTTISQPSTTPAFNATAIPYVNQADIQVPWSLSYVDSPATTSATTYKIQAKSGGTWYVNGGRSSNDFAQTSTMIVMEIAV